MVDGWFPTVKKLFLTIGESILFLLILYVAFLISHVLQYGWKG